MIGMTTKKLFDYGFSVVENLKLDDSLSGIQLKVVGGVSKSVPVECAITPSVAASDMPSDIHREIRLEPFVYAPVDRGGNRRGGTILSWRSVVSLCPSGNGAGGEKY